MTGQWEARDTKVSTVITSTASLELEREFQSLMVHGKKEPPLYCVLVVMRHKLLTVLSHIYLEAPTYTFGTQLDFLPDYDFVCSLFNCEYRVTHTKRLQNKLLQHFCFYFCCIIFIIIQIYSHGLSGQTVSANLAAH